MLRSGPDSCHSWSVVVGCSCVMLLMTVPTRLSGLLYVTCIEHFNAQRETAAMPFIVLNVLKSLSGPIVGYLGDVFGLRCMTVIGCFLASSGMALCFFAHDMTFIICAIGLIYSAGFTLSISLIPSIIKQHFVKYISNSCGLSFAGTCVSALIFPDIFKYLWKHYGVSGAFIITAGIMFHAVPISMLLKSPKWSKAGPRKLTLDDKLSSTEKTISLGDVSTGYKVVTCAKIESKVDLVEMSTFSGKSHCVSATYFNDNDHTNATEIINQDCSESYAAFSHESAPKTVETSQNLSYKTLNLDVNETSEKPLQKEHSEEMNFQHSNAPKTDISKKQKALRKHLKALKTLRIFYNPNFILIMITHSLQHYFMFFVWTLVIDISRDKSISTDLETYHLMFLAVTEAVGYVGLGWVTDKRFLTKTNFCGFSFLAISLSFALMSWSTGFVTLIAAVGVFGVFSSALTTVYPGVVFMFIEKEEQTMALTSRMILQAPLSFTAASLIGYFRGNYATGTYDNLLYFLSGLSCLCAVLISLLPLVYKHFRPTTNIKI